jgi:putative transposase
MRLVNFVSGEYYHIFNRGVDKRDVFLEGQDFARFLEKIEEYSIDPEDGAALVEVSAYCLMDNHYHLILHQQKERGISRFMQRLVLSHVQFMNKKYKRSGCLFEGPFRAKHVDTEGYLARLTAYIHANPSDRGGDTNTHTGARGIFERCRLYDWSDCSLYLAGKGPLLWLFDDVAYEQFLMQQIRWTESVPGTAVPGTEG